MKNWATFVQQKTYAACGYLWKLTRHPTTFSFLGWLFWIICSFVVSVVAGLVVRFYF